MDSAIRNIIIPSDNIIVPSTMRQTAESKNLNYRQHYNNNSILNSPIYDEIRMKAILDGISQNIWQKMDAKNMSVRNLAEVSGTTYCGLSNIFNYKKTIGLRSLIKIAYALECSPVDFFPYDLNRRKSNGDRFDEITKNLDLDSVNYLLELSINFAKLKNKR